MKLDRDKLIRAREMLGYGVEKTAEEAGVSKNSVLRAEHEEDIRPVTARKIAAALEVRVADLLGKAEAPGQPETLVDRLLQAPPTQIEGLSDTEQAELERGGAVFVPPVEGEEPDVVILRRYYVRLLEENDRLLQEVARLRGQLEKIGRSRE